MRKIIKALIFAFTMILLISVCVISQMIDVWVWGEESTLIDTISGWMAFFICAVSLKELNNIYGKI